MISVLIKFILLAIFNISFFTITKASCTLSMWVSYGFIHFSFLMLFIEPLFVRTSKNSKHVAIESLTLITILYFFLTLIVGIFFLFNPLLFVYQYSVETFITGIYLIFLISNIIINNKIASNENEISIDKQFLDNVYIKAEFIKQKITDSKTIVDLQEIVKYSPVKSSANARIIEKQIIDILDEITLRLNTIEEDEIINKISNCKNLLNQRNLILKK